MKTLALEYLKYSHALEIVAGMNFKTARKDLDNRGALTAKLKEDLFLCHIQEMAHARMVLGMMHILNKRISPEIKEIPARIIAGLSASVSTPWPEEMFPYAMISFNHAFESRFASGGVTEFASNMLRFSRKTLAFDKRISLEEREEFESLVDDFHLVVQRDEKWHVNVDAAVMKIYKDIHGFDMEAFLKTAQVARSPSMRGIIRAKQAFLRAIR